MLSAFTALNITPIWYGWRPRRSVPSTGMTAFRSPLRQKNTTNVAMYAESRTRPPTRRAVQRARRDASARPSTHGSAGGCGPAPVGCAGGSLWPTERAAPLALVNSWTAAKPIAAATAPSTNAARQPSCRASRPPRAGTTRPATENSASPRAITRPLATRPEPPTSQARIIAWHTDDATPISKRTAATCHALPASAPRIEPTVLIANATSSTVRGFQRRAMPPAGRSVIRRARPKAATTAPSSP